MSRTYVRRRIVASAVVVATVVLVWSPVAGALGRGREGIAAAERVVVVRPGDTLWAIAERESPGADPRGLVDAIASRNGIDPGSIVPGQALVIPGSG